MKRWVTPSILVLTACIQFACRPSPTPPPEAPPSNPPPGCTPTTCQALGKNCGSIPDGCGGTLDCGGCGQGETCGGSGTPNVCGSSACQPTTCQAQGKNCGTLSNGCGGTLDCGGCGQGQTCGGGGTPNVCGSPACKPTTCQAQGRNCGSIPDGCGGTLDCGGCGDGQTCGGGGTPNVCAVPSGATRWTVSIKSSGNDELLSVAGTPDGGSVTIGREARRAAAGAQAPFVLTRYDASGHVIWARVFPYEGSGARPTSHALAVSRSGEIYLAFNAGCVDFGCRYPVDFGGGGVGISALVKFAPDGHFLWQTKLNESAYDLAVDSQGNAVVLSSMFFNLPNIEVRRFNASGQQLWIHSVRNLRLVTTDPAGNVVLGFFADEDTTLTGAPKLPTGWVVVELDPAGAFRWVRSIPGASSIEGIGTSALGTVVVTGAFTSRLTWGNDTLTTAVEDTYLLTIEADGSPRWARALNTPLVDRVLAVDPTGRAAVTGQHPDASAFSVVTYNLAGAPLWTRSITSAAFPGGGTLHTTSIAYGSDHSVFVTGNTYPTTNQTPSEANGFLIQLAP